MPPTPKHRDVAPFLSRVRDFFLGRSHKTAHRFADTMSRRTQPQPDIPRGQLNTLTQSYFARDPRRAVRQPVDLVEENKRLLAAKEAAEKNAEPKKTCDGKEPVKPKARKKPLPTPGSYHSWEGPD
ncbi:hypothetical protein KR074_000161 [Drosophila pseudoananassae]|nr:hypothetical protein KR074_000161 [Drosophila pseudoananassae]